MALRALLDALLAALAPALAGCGGDDEGGATTAAAPPPATATSPVTDVVTLTATGPGTSTDAPGEERLRQALLTEGDLGEGWVEGTPGESQGLCGLEPLEERALEEVRAGFAGDAPPALLNHQVMAFPAGVAEQVMREARDAYASCEQTGPEGAGVRLSALPDPPLGDEAAAFSGEVSQGAGPPLRVELVLIRRSSLVALIAYAGEAEPERSALDPALSEADRRLFMLAGA